MKEINGDHFMLKQSELVNADIKVAKDNMDTDHSRLLTIKQFCSAFPWPSESAMRSYIYRAKELGISDAFVRVRRRVLVLPYKFFSLIKEVEGHSNKGGKYETTSCQKGRVHL